MTAAIGVKIGNRIEVVTDTAVTENGLFCDLMCKIEPLAHHPAAVVIRGKVDYADKLRAVLDNIFVNAGTVDDAIGAIRAAVAAQSKPAASMRSTAEVTLFAISETKGPQILWFQTGTSAAGRSPWTMYEVDHGITTAESIPAWAIEAYRASGTLADKATYLLNGVRAGAKAWDGNPALQGVGGGIDHTVIDASGVRTTHIYDWACDEEGRLLTSNPPRDAAHIRGKRIFEATPQVRPTLAAPTMNRTQRRLAAKQARRAA